MLQKLDENQFDRIYEIMEQSFPVDEHRPYEEQKSLFDNQEYQIYTICDAGKEQIVAFIAMWEYENIAFIEHFAVDSAYRNQGMGAGMLQELQKLLDKKMCLEVEFPENEITRRRIEFYERNGFYLNEYPYIQPALSKGQEEVPLLIMTTRGKIDETEFLIIKDLLYKKVYKL